MDKVKKEVFVHYINENGIAFATCGQEHIQLDFLSETELDLQEVDVYGEMTIICEQDQDVFIVTEIL